MRRRQLIEKLLETKSKKEQRFLLKKHKNLLDREFAKVLKDTYYVSWTNEPRKTHNAARALHALHEILPHDEIKALAFWVSGIAELTKGKFEKSDANLERAARIFFSLGREREAAETQVPRLIALAMTGRYAEAIAAGKTAARIFEKFGDELALGKIEKNLGNIVARQGDDAAAEKYYLAARKRFLKIANAAELIMAENSLANTYAELNDFRKAEKFYASALQNARAAKMIVTEAEIEASMGNLAAFRGRFGEALRFLEFSRQKYEILAMPHQTAIAELEIADIYLELNLAPEASAIYQKIVPELHKLKLRSEEARARANFGRAALVLNDLKTARKELRKSAELYQSEKNPIGAAAVKIAEADLELGQENYEKAFRLAREAEQFLAANENLRLLLKAKSIAGETLRNLGKFAAAEKILLENLALAKKFEQPQNALAALNSLGKLSLQTKDLGKAESFFKRAARLVETLRAPLAAEEFRMSFLADKLAPFENLVRIYLSQNKFKQAFEMVERARARALAESLSDALTAEKSSKNSARLSEKLQSVREELNWFYSRLNRADSSENEKLLREARRREKEIANLLRQIESIAERRKTEKQKFAPAKLQLQLGRRRALVEFIGFDGSFSAFVITNEKIFFFADLATETEVLILLEGLRFQFGALRYGAKNLGAFLPELKKRADIYLEKLYDKLLAPLENISQNLNLVIVPVGALHYVPFHALRDEKGKYTVENREIIYAPSATVWQFLSEKPKRRKTKNALLIGFADEKIPLVDREIQALKKILPAAKAFTGKRATFSAYQENAGRFDILHLACHGHFRPENPFFSSLHLADGWITVRDIYEQNLKAELVTLSACETGLNTVFPGEEILGLARGFLSAGAKNLVLSLWTVSDEATTTLMGDFYGNLQRGESIPASLKTAQNNFIRRGVHPYFWAPFAVIGK